MTVLKNIFFPFLFTMLLVTTLQAQETTTESSVRKYNSGITQGYWMLHVNATGSKSNSPVSGSFTNYTIAPQFGYLISNNFVIGVQVGFGKEHFYKIDPFSSSSSGTKRYPVKTFTQEVFARYYVLPFRFKPFAQLTLGENRYKSDDKQIYDVKGYKFNGTVAVGASFFVSPKFSLEAMYNYRYPNEVISTGTQANGMLRIGLSYFIGKE